MIPLLIFTILITTIGPSTYHYQSAELLDEFLVVSNIEAEVSIVYNNRAFQVAILVDRDWDGETLEGEFISRCIAGSVLVYQSIEDKSTLGNLIIMYNNWYLVATLESCCDLILMYSTPGFNRDYLVEWIGRELLAVPRE